MPLITKVLSDTQLDAVNRVGFDYSSTTKRDVETCNLCGSRVWTQIAHHDRYYHATGVFLCSSCGNVFLSPVMTEDEYSRFYAAYYRPLVSAYHGRLIDAQTYKEDQRPYADELAAFLHSTHTRGFTPGSILDVGSSTGVVALRVAAEFEPRPDIVCLDPNVTELAEAQKAGLTSVLGFVETHDFASEAFDLILLCQTIDHLLDIRLALTKIHYALHSQGFFFVDFVDFRRVYLETGAVEGAVKIDHCYYLTDATTEAYLAATGFEVVKKGIARDKVHVNYLCRKVEPRDVNLSALTPHSQRLYAEIRTLRSRT